MDRWRGVLKVPLHASAETCYRVAASLCLSPTSKTLTVPSANAIFLNGDRVAGTGNPVIEKLSDLQNIAEILVSKIGDSINAWVIEASVFSGPFAVYRDFVPSVNEWGDPKSYWPIGLPASGSLVLLLSSCLEEVKNDIARQKELLILPGISTSQFDQSKTLIFGFSKGGIVLKQIVTELGFSDVKSSGGPVLIENKQIGVEAGIHIIPNTAQGLLNSLREIHYVDVGLNSCGAYITDHGAFEKISERLMIQGATGIRFVLHGTPRQWCDNRRAWICKEKDKMVHLLESEAQRSGGKLQVSEKFYFTDRTPNLHMHFEVIEKMDVS